MNKRPAKKTNGVRARRTDEPSGQTGALEAAPGTPAPASLAVHDEPSGQTGALEANDDLPRKLAGADPERPWHSSKTFESFRWECDDPQQLVLGRRRMADARPKHTRKSAINWDSLEWTDNGVLVTFKNPVVYRTAYAFFSRLLDKTKENTGRGKTKDRAPLCGGVLKAVVTKSENPLQRAEACSPERSPHGASHHSLAPPVLSEASIAPSADMASGHHGSGANALAAHGEASGLHQASVEASAHDGPSFPLSPGLKLVRGRPQEFSESFALGSKLGQGSYGEVYIATHRGSGKTYAVKRLRGGSQTRPADKLEALHECYVLDRCHGHPNIVQLLDVFVNGPPLRQFMLLFELWGKALSMWPRAGPFEAETLRIGAYQVGNGIRHLHDMGMVHGDIKPSNILANCVGAKASKPQFVFKLGDVGSVVEASAEHRLRESGNIQTVFWRAPEVLLGSLVFGLPIDVWSYGLVLVEMAGERFHHGNPEFVAHRQLEVFTMQLGTPDERFCQSWPRREFKPRRERKDWSVDVRKHLGHHGALLVGSLLMWKPQDRLTIAEALRHEFFEPGSFKLGGVVSRGTGASCQKTWEGRRHGWNVLVGCMAPEVLEWIRDDDALRPGSQAWQALGVQFTGSGTGTDIKTGTYVLSKALWQESSTIERHCVLLPLCFVEIHLWPHDL